MRALFLLSGRAPRPLRELQSKALRPRGRHARGKGGALFGYTDLYGGYNGGQAEYVRVPTPTVGPRKVPERLTDEQVLFTTDILPTGWTAIEWAELKGGETVAVFGCGPVGLATMKCAWLRGAARVIGVDREEYRLTKAREIAKAETVNVDKRRRRSTRSAR